MEPVGRDFPRIPKQRDDTVRIFVGNQVQRRAGLLKSGPKENAEKRQNSDDGDFLLFFFRQRGGVFGFYAFYLFVIQVVRRGQYRKADIRSRMKAFHIQHNHRNSQHNGPKGGILIKNRFILGGKPFAGEELFVAQDKR